MKRFAELYRALDATTRTGEKVAAMAAYFDAEPAEDAVWAVSLLTATRRKRVVTSRQLIADFQAESGMPAWLLEESRAHVGDSGETVALLLGELRPCSANGKAQTAHTAPAAHGDLPLCEWMQRIVPELGTLGDDGRRARLREIWQTLSPDDVFVFHKILTGGFRVGVSRRLVVRALFEASGVPQPVLYHRLMGRWTETADFYLSLVSQDDAELPPSTPYPFFLAEAADKSIIQSLDLAAWRIEWKWDGIRAQLVKRQREVWLWSRGEELVNAQFPEIVAAAASLPDGTVLDGELVAWQDGTPLSFQHLQKRLGRETVSTRMRERIPVHMIVYDALEIDAKDIRGLPLDERAAWAGKIIGQTWGLAATEARPCAANAPESADGDADPRYEGGARFHLSEPLPVATVADLEAYRGEARRRGVEGLMIKSRGGAYGVGRVRGVWWKYKVDPFTLDAVLIYAQAGSGKRANLFTDYTFAIWKGEELVPFAKAYSGLSNSEIASLDRWIRQNTIEKFGPVRSVKPELVFEIAFEGIAPSRRHKSGFAVRFPRILRPRPDKPAAEADTTGSAEDILQIFFQNSEQDDEA